MGGSVLESVRAGGVVSPSQRYVALVSGGRDSVCLLDVLVSICGPAAIGAPEFGGLVGGAVVTERPRRGHPWPRG